MLTGTCLLVISQQKIGSCGSVLLVLAASFFINTNDNGELEVEM